MKTPTIQIVHALLRELKPQIGDKYRADEEIDVPSMLVTVGCDAHGNWNYQTGDTQFTGGAYGKPYWGQATLLRNSNCRELARQIVAELKEAQAEGTP